MNEAALWREATASGEARQGKQGVLWFPLPSSPCVWMQTQRAPSAGQRCPGLVLLQGSSVPVPGDVPVATLRKAVWVGRRWHRCRGGSAAGGSARPVAAGGVESRTGCCFLGGEGNVLGLLRPMQRTLCVFNEQGQVLDLHSASN